MSNGAHLLVHLPGHVHLGAMVHKHQQQDLFKDQQQGSILMGTDLGAAEIALAELDSALCPVAHNARAFVRRRLATTDGRCAAGGAADFELEVACEVGTGAESTLLGPDSELCLQPAALAPDLPVP